MAITSYFKVHIPSYIAVGEDRNIIVVGDNDGQSIKTNDELRHGTKRASLNWIDCA